VFAVPYRFLWCHPSICGDTPVFVVSYRCLWCHTNIRGVLPVFAVPYLYLWMPCRYLRCHILICGAISLFVVPYRYLWCHTRIFLEGLTENRRRRQSVLGRSLNPRPLEHETQVSCTGPRRFAVITVIRCMMRNVSSEAALQAVRFQGMNCSELTELWLVTALKQGGGGGG
jgi:hypothetical protein